MKRLLAYLFIIFGLGLGHTFLFAGEIVTINKKDVIKFQTNDKKFTKQLNWDSHYSDKDWKKNNVDKTEGVGKPCFLFVEAHTYDVKQIAFEFKYYNRSSGQDGNCINEIYEISVEPNDSFLYHVGVGDSGKAFAFEKFDFSKRNKYFYIVTNNNSKSICVKWASTKGVTKDCFNTQLPIQKFSKLFKTRLDAIKMREESKGNLVVVSTPKEIETSVTDTSGPKIDVPGKLVAKNDQIILTGKITDDNQVASVKIDNTPVVLDKKGNFEIDLYVPLDGLKVSIEAIDKFTNKTSRTILISREQKESEEQIVKLPSLNPTKIDAKMNPNALALVVGITNYKNIPISIYADKDAKLFADYAYRSLGISRDKIKLLVNDSANYIEIKTALKRWLKNEIVENKSDIYVFFAGHGLVSDNQKDLYLIPYNGDPSLLEDTSFKRSDLFSLIEESKPSSITAFFDTCYSGLTRQNEMLIADARPLKVVADESSLSPNVNLISAASNNEIASSLEAAEHGMFSYYLMEGLGGNADLDQNKNITVGELHKYVKNRVKEKAAKLGRDQNPQVSGNKDKVLVKLN